jgi:3-hydroxybutyryl-CoA dehydrogenase
MEPTTFRRAAVVGAGLMGRRIAGVAARGGLDVVLTDSNAEILDAALAVASGISEGDGNLSTSADLAAAVAGADLVIEAIAENLQTKQALFVQLSQLLPDAVLATNTSVLPVTSIAAGANNPGRVVGMHWWNPADLIPVVEVVRGEHTEPAVVDQIVVLPESWGKLPIRVERDVPGFIGNRLQFALWREATAIVAAGICDAATLDLVVRNTIGLRLTTMGPMENADYIGLDLTLAIEEAVLPSLNRDPRPHTALRDAVARGDLGAKSGQGFLTWPAGAREDAAARLDAHIAAQLRGAGSAVPQSEA